MGEKKNPQPYLVNLGYVHIQDVWDTSYLPGKRGCGEEGEVE